jgi:flagellar biosynthesis protein FlhB
MDSKIELARPRDFGETITDTFGFIKQNFKPLLKYFFIFCGFFLVATFAIMVLTEVKALSFMSYTTSANSFDEGGNLSRMFSLLGGYLLLFVFIVLNYVAINVTVLCFMTLYKQKQNTIPTTEEMWGYFKYYYLRVLGSSVLLYILMMLGFAFCLIPGITCRQYLPLYHLL